MIAGRVYFHFHDDWGGMDSHPSHAQWDDHGRPLQNPELEEVEKNDVVTLRLYHRQHMATLYDNIICIYINI